MEKETYKVAVEILNRFGDRQSLSRPQAMSTSTVSKPMPKMSAGISPAPVQRLPALRIGASMPQPNQMIRYAITSTPVNLEKSLGPFRNPNGNRLDGPPVPSPILPSAAQSNLRQRSITPYNPNQVSKRQQLPFPIIDFEHKGVLEKMVDYLIGDGPSNRFAMICSTCNKHNGMALEEEYCYKTFQCFHCNTVNPAKKLRPGAPTLPTATTIDLKSPETIAKLKDQSHLLSASSSSSSSDEEIAEIETDVVAEQPAATESIGVEQVEEGGVNLNLVENHEDVVDLLSVDEDKTEDGSVVEKIVESEEDIHDEQTNKTIVEKKNE